MALPKTIGATADKLYTVRRHRLELEKTVAGLKSEESELKAHGSKLLGEQGLTSGSGQLATFSVHSSPIPVVEDWEVLYHYISAHEAYDLLQRRISHKAWMDRVEADGMSIQGIRGESILKVTLTKKRGAK